MNYNMVLKKGTLLGGKHYSEKVGDEVTDEKLINNIIRIFFA